MVKKNRRKTGFTLTELLIVLAIIAILTTIAIPVVSGLMKKGMDTTEDVNAAHYTSIMQKFAAEDVGGAALYPRLTAGGANSEYSIFAAKAGKGTLPGYNIIAGSGGSDVLAQIRKEAVIAIKAYSDTAVNDEYFIPPPADGNYEYVYYYLTGQVKKVKSSDLSSTDAADYLNGVINVNEYWVYLSRDGGSGAALGGVANGHGHMFVQVLQFGTGEPLDCAQVTVYSGARSFSAVTKPRQNGYVGFSGIPEGTVRVCVEYQGAVSFPNTTYYSKTGEVLISSSGYEGCQMNLPYIVEMKLGSLGSLGFYEETVTWNNVNWTESREKITDNILATTDFKVNTSKPSSTARAEQYLSNLRTTSGVQELLEGNKFLTYGHYVMSVSSYGYRTYQENIEARTFGIDNAAGKYSGFTRPYEYPVVLRSPAGQSGVSGVITWESAQQPLEGTSRGLSGTWAVSDIQTVRARVKLTNQETGVSYYSSYFSYNSDGKYAYSVSGLPDGTYAFAIDSPYGHVNMANFPRTVTVDGRKIVVSGAVLRQDSGEGTVKGKITHDYRGYYDPIPGVAGTLTRYGDSYSSASFTTNSSGDFAPGVQLKKGFYQLTLKMPAVYGGTTYYYRLFVNGNKNFTISLPIAVVTLTGTVYPYDANYYAITKTGTLSKATVKFKRVSSDGKTEYSTVSASVNGTGVNAAYSVSLTPGYYYATVKSICFKENISTRFEVRAAGTRYFYLYVDDTNKSNHTGLSRRSNASQHWDECTNCGQKFNVAVHSKSAWTYSSASYCYRCCTVCNYVTDSPSAHTLTSYISKAATCTVSGTRVYYCTKGCGYTYSQTIVATGHVGNGSWIYDNNGSASNVGTHYQNCKNCGTKMNAGSACSRGGKISNGLSNHYDVCSKCGGRRYFNHNWKETSRNGYACTGGTIYYKCSECGATKTGSYGATGAHNTRARCSQKHSCSWTSYCSAGGTHKWQGYYHILCSVCGSASSDGKWCFMHCSKSLPVKPCPY